MTGMVTYAGLDVHARSTHAAAIDVSTGELLRARFGPGVEGPVEWLLGLPGPVRACYEAGPTGFGLYRAASAAGVSVEVIAPGKTEPSWVPRRPLSDPRNPGQIKVSVKPRMAQRAQSSVLPPRPTVAGQD
jgi:transposase